MNPASLSDETATFAELKARIWEFSQERDWIQFHSPKNLSMALAAEAAELMEHYLWAGSEESRQSIKDPKKGPRIREELADILIYAIEFANVNDIDLSSAINDKIALNAQKYPAEKARGRSEKYTDL